jgi:all-trans-retinol dehydrogenase (NAD+)
MDAHKSYQKAEVSETTLLGSLKFLWVIVVVCCKSIVLSIPVLFNWIIELFVPPKPKNISGQLAVVTGGSAGIGKEIAMRLAQEGCNIAIANRNIIEGQKTAEEIKAKFGVEAKAFKVDVSRNEDVAKFKDDVENQMGHVDILVNNAGLLALSISILEGTPENIQQIIDVNLTSYFWVSSEQIFADEAID